MCIVKGKNISSRILSRMSFLQIHSYGKHDIKCIAVYSLEALYWFRDFWSTCFVSNSSIEVAQCGSYFRRGFLYFSYWGPTQNYNTIMLFTEDVNRQGMILSEMNLSFILRDFCPIPDSQEHLPFKDNSTCHYSLPSNLTVMISPQYLELSICLIFFLEFLLS